MYKLLIADDERVIREGLRDIINWGSLGFQIIATYEDGQQVVNHLENDMVDAIITDIKMNGKSGLDVAKYVYNKKLPIKIILISGYKEVDLAMSAIEYNVKKYILKPIDIDILNDAVLELKSILDKEAKAQLDKIALEAVKKGMEELKNDFIDELLIGSFKNYNYIISMFRFLYPFLDIENSTCFITTLVIENYSDLSANTPSRSKNELYMCLKNCIRLSSSKVEYHMITKNGDLVQLLGIILSPIDPKRAKVLIHSTNEKLRRDLFDILFIHSTIKDIEIYDTISDVMHFQYSNTDITNMDDSLILRIKENMKRIHSVILSGNSDAASNLARKLGKYFQFLDIDLVRSLVMNLFAEIDKRLMEYPIIATEFSISQHIDKLYSMDSKEEIGSFLSLSIHQLASLINKTQHSEGNVIDRAKQYIVDHITDDISLEDVSEKFYISQSHFSRIFKAQTGENFIDFVVRKKIDYAVDLMKNPKYKIYEISNIVGYKSSNYFRKVFKNYTGYSPSEYRKLFYHNRKA